MSQPVDAVRYSAECRDCGHEVERPMPRSTSEDIYGIRVRCAECERTNWAERDHYEVE